MMMCTSSRFTLCKQLLLHQRNKSNNHLGRGRGLEFEVMEMCWDVVSVAKNIPPVLQRFDKGMWDDVAKRFGREGPYLHLPVCMAAQAPKISACLGGGVSL